MARSRIDWMDLAHRLDCEREAIQDTLPKGTTVSLTLTAYHFSDGAQYGAQLDHDGLFASGSGRTPAKALEAAKGSLQKQINERARRPRLVEATPKALEAPRTCPQTLWGDA